MPKRTHDPIELFWRKVNKNGPIPERRPDLGPCWLWTAYITPSTGYGWFGYGGRNGTRTTGHRFAYETFVGPVPEGWHVDHLCMVRACVNPGHLEAVTHGENLRRGAEARGKPTHCKQGHEFTPENTRVTPRQIFCRQCNRDRGAAFRARRRDREEASRDGDGHE